MPRFRPSRHGIEAWLEAEREQLPLWIPVAVACGVAGWFVLPGRTAWIGFGCGAAGLATLGLGLGRHGRAPRALALFALAALAGLCLVWLRAERAAVPRLDRPRVATFAARIERVEPLPARAATRLLLSPQREPGLPPRIRINVDTDKVPQGLARGATVSLRAQLAPPPSAAVPGAYDYAAIAWFQGIGAVGKALDPVRVIAAAPRRMWSDRLADARTALSAHIQSRLPPGPAGIAAALATGDMGAVSEADNDAFRRSGLAHLLSVSGLHLTAVVGGVMLVALRLMALSPWFALRAPLPLLAAAAGALAGIGYTLLTGAEVPTVRSLVAALIVLLGLALGREALTLRMVATGAMVVLLLWPEQAAGPSFQLSFAAILAIVALHELRWTRSTFERREEGLLRGLARSTAGLLLTGLTIEIALMPIAVFHFHRAGFYGAIANIAAIPLTTFVIMPAEAAALLADLAGLGAPFWALTRWALRALLWLAYHVAALPGSVALIPTMGRCAYALIVAGGLWLALWRTRLRLWGLMPAAVGIALTMLGTPPDLLVTGDYVRDALSELGGREGDAALAIEALPGAACTRDACTAVLVRNGRTWHLLATRSPYIMPRATLRLACAQADIVVSERRLPGWCRPRWLRADAALLARTGGLAIRLAPPSIATVAAIQVGHPWAGAKASLRLQSAGRVKTKRAPSPAPLSITMSPPIARASRREM